MKLTRLVNICSGNWIYISNFSLPGAHPGSLFAICAPDIIFLSQHPPQSFAITSNAYLQITWKTIMRTQTFLKVAVLTGLLALAGCSSKVAAPDQYSGFLKDYSGLKQTTSATGKPTLRWVDPSYNEANYDNIVWNPITYYPAPKPTTQIGQRTLDELLSYTNNKMKTSIGQRKPIVTKPGPRSLIFRGAITGVTSKQEGLQFYEVVPVALVVAGTQMASGHRTMDTHLYFEGELIDAKTGKPVIKVVRKGEGKELANENTPMGFATLKQVVDDMATDATMFDVLKTEK